MTDTVVVSRVGRDFNDMIEMWDWLVVNFGNPKPFETWNGTFAFSYDDYVRFTFYDEQIGILARLKFSEICLEDDAWKIKENDLWR